MCTLFANRYALLTRGPHMVYMGTPYIFYIYMIRCGWLGNYLDVNKRNYTDINEGNYLELPDSRGKTR